MTRLVAIVFLIALAFVLVRYRTNEKVQKYVVLTLVGGFFVYTIGIVLTELMR